MCKRKLLMICSASNTVINFRKELILFLEKKDFDITVIVADDKRTKEILELGVSVKVIPFDNRSKNPFSFFSLKKRIRNVIAELKPDIIFTFQAKPNIIGSLATKKFSSANVYSMIEGLGDPFQAKTLKEKVVKRIISFLYKKALKTAKRVFFLNDDDRNEFIANNIIQETKCIVIPGIGIDLKAYPFNGRISTNKRVVILSRLLKNKGIIDCCEIAKKVKSIRPDVEFYLFGDEANIKKSDLSEYTNPGYITYKGFTTDVQKEILDSRLLLSCSYREGFPRIFLEAMACGRVIIASNVIGNRAVIENGITGFLLPLHDIQSFVNNIISIIDDEQLLKRIAANARATCEERFNSEIINTVIYETIRS